MQNPTFENDLYQVQNAFIYSVLLCSLATYSIYYEYLFDGYQWLLWLMYQSIVYLNK